MKSEEEQLLELAGWSKVKGAVVQAGFPSDILITPEDCDKDYWMKDESVFCETIEEALKIAEEEAPQK